MAVNINIPKPTYTKNDIGLGNVDNTSDLNKPISTATQTALDGKVDKVTGKGLSENDFTDALKTKLDGIEAGAEVNVNADWNATSGDAQILNKPTIPDASGFVEKSDYTPAHSILAQQSGTGSPTAVTIGTNEILGRLSGGGGNIEGLNTSQVKTLLNYIEGSTTITINGTTLDLSANRSFSAVMLQGSPVQSNIATGGALRYYGFSDNVSATVETSRRIFITNACTLKNFYVRTSGTQPASGSHVLTVLKNGVATSIVATVPAGSGAGVFSDTTNSETFAQGDEISILAVNNASSTSSVIISFSLGSI